MWLSALVLSLAWGCASTPEYLSMEGDQLWETGVQAFDEGDWEEAIRRLERLVNQFAGHPQSPEARIYIARAYEERGEYISAAAEYERFLQYYFNHGLAPDASLGICESYAELSPHPQRDQSYTERARDACGVTAREFQGLSVAQTADSIRTAMVDRLAESVFVEAEFYQRAGLHNSAILVFEDLVARFPETPWAPRAIQGMYQSYTELGWEEEAVEAAERLEREYPGSEPAQALREEGTPRAAAPDGPTGLGG
ncbi:MAG: outer membrane protein assembly factor BamD [Gemmatimonadota bacterium]